MRELLTGRRIRANSLSRGLLTGAIVALILAALATLLGAHSVVRTSGTLAWALGFAGAVLGLVAERGNRTL